MWKALEKLFCFRHIPPEIRAIEARLDPEELKTIQNGFEKDKKTHSLPYPAFISWLRMEHLEISFWEALCRLIDVSKSGCIRYNDYLLALDNAGDIGMRLAESDVPLFVSECLKWNLIQPKNYEIQSIVQGIQRDAEKHRSVAAWFETYPVFLKSVRSMIYGFGSDLHLEKSPILKKAHSQCLLTPAFAWILASNLNSSWKKEWELLFSTGVDGKSFQTCMARIRNKGVTLLIIQDDTDAIFGGLASTPWEGNGRFFGDYNSQIFSLTPTFQIFKPSGMNENFQWCGERFKELPNGLGFGGQVGFFSLFVDASFDSGMSLETNTFKSPTLSSQPRFHPKKIECWLVEGIEENPAQKESSVLDRFQEDQKVLSLMGRTQYSEGVRDATSEGL